MENILELYVNGSIIAPDTIGKIDLFGDEPINLTISIADIKDISKRNSTFSQNFTIPATKNNNVLLNHIFNIGSDATFDPSKKTPCYMLNDYIQVFSGVLQLTKIKVDNMNVVSYDIVVYGDVIDLVKKLGDKLIIGNLDPNDDLDFSELDHYYNANTILASWTADTKTLGYYYPLIDYGDDLDLADISPGGTILYNGANVPRGLNPDKFRPALSAKVLFDKIIRKTNQYTYNSTFLNSDIFTECVIPFNGDVNSVYKLDYTNKFKFAAIKNADQTNTAQYAQQILFQTLYTPPSTYYTYNTSTSSFTMNEIMSTKLKMDLSVSFSQSCIPPDSSTGQIGRGISFRWRRSTFAGVFHQQDYIFENGVVAFTRYPVSTETPFLNNPLSNRYYPLQPGEKISCDYYIYGSFAGSFNSLYFTIHFLNSSFYNEMESKSLVGGYINYNDLIPKNIKQVDFIKSIITMFNLLVLPYADDPTKLQFIPRDDYFNSGVIKDWTKKVNFDKNIEMTLLSEQQNKVINFSYKEDKDYYNTDYKEKTNKVFGEHKEVIDNEWVEGEKKISISFSPTPVDKLIGSNDIFLPKIAKYDVATKVYSKMDFNIRFLRKNKIPMSTIHPFKIIGIPVQTVYPYCGHLDNPLYSNVDYNFGTINFSYYKELTTLTGNNLINTYWRTYLDGISDKNSRMIKCYIYLTPNDINTFRYNDSIFIQGLTDDGGHYFNVNKIVYSPTSNLPSLVELIKTTKIKVIPKSTPIKNLGMAPIKIVSLGRNFIESGDTLINGDNNMVGYNSKGSVIFGNNNIIADNTPGVVLINANNQYIDTPFVTIVGNTYFYPDGTSAPIYNDIDCGEDAVLAPFGTNAYNDIDCGQDEVLGLFSTSPVQDIDEGEDKVF